MAVDKGDLEMMVEFDARNAKRQLWRDDLINFQMRYIKEDSQNPGELYESIPISLYGASSPELAVDGWVDDVSTGWMAAGMEPSGSLPPFKDSELISSWARDAVAAATVRQVLGGYPDSSFKPQAVATRAEAFTVIVKALPPINRKFTFVK